MPAKIIFVTGTDTGVGKTLLSGLLLSHLRHTGCHALGIKPFCCGGRDDIELLHAIQEGELSEKEITPFYFPEPLAPLVAAQKHRRIVRLSEVVAQIKTIRKRCEVLVIEGVGGLMVPLGTDYSVADLIGKLDCDLVIVARNRLGTLNHTLLTGRFVQDVLRKRFTVVLMGGAEVDLSARTNGKVLAEWLAPARVLELPFMEKNALSKRALENNSQKFQKTLAQVLA